jgi:preprotein translocase subunit SecE
MATTNEKQSTVSRTPGFVTNTVRFIEEVIVELKKTTWPTPREAWRLTMVVLAVIIVVAVYVGIIDFLLTKLTIALHLFE